MAARPPSLCRCALCCLSVLLEENRLTEVVTVWLTRPAGGKTVQPVVKKCLFFLVKTLEKKKAEKYGWMRPHAGTDPLFLSLFPD